MCASKPANGPGKALNSEAINKPIIMLKMSNLLLVVAVLMTRHYTRFWRRRFVCESIDVRTAEAEI